MNRIKFHEWEGMPELPKNIPPGTHIHAMKFELPDSIEQLDKAMEHFCRMFHESSLEHNQPLASIMCGFVSPEGAMPYMCQLLAEKFDQSPSKMAIAVLTSMGAKFIKLERLQAKEQCKREGIPDDKIELEWLLGHQDKYTFTHVCAVMEDKIQCDCPACVMFWAGRQSVMANGQEGMALKMNELVEFIKSDKPRYGKGCVLNLVKGSRTGKWVRDDYFNDIGSENTDGGGI